MRKLLIISAILFCFSYLKSQDYISIDKVSKIFVYDYEFNANRDNVYSGESHEMILEVGSKSSKFYSSAKAYVDSLLMLHADEEPGVAMVKIMPMIMGVPVPKFCKFYIYKNYPEKGDCVYTAGDWGSGDYKIEEKLSFNWEIDNTADTVILGYNCVKAYTSYAGRDYTAWFTPEIPISDGPYKFNGLPGLILYISDSANEHIFSLYGIDDGRSKPIYYIDDKYINTTSKGYFKALEASKIDFIQMLERGTFDSEATKIRAFTKLNNMNNYIELY